ncbi:MAG: RNA polymerase factor sigma-54 [Ichthyobacteriaceae bacterium]|nr:RNA polymerase factor sigma-54 [Ichthyobacteriaceae bacterium]
MSKQKQSLSQKQLQKLSPQQIQLMNMVQLPLTAFEQEIRREVEENPALEIKKTETEDSIYDTTDNSEIKVDEYLNDDEPQYKYKANNYSTDDEDNQIPYAGGITLIEHLLEQISAYNLTDEQYILAEYIIGNIDEDGYIRRDLLSISDDLAFNYNIYTDENELLSILKIVQKLEPVGVGARDLKECIKIQIESGSHTIERKIALEIINNYFDDFANKHHEKIIEDLEIDVNSFKDAVELISMVTPKPGLGFSTTDKLAEQITPDFEIKIIDGKLELSMNGGDIPSLNVSPSYTEAFETYKESTNASKELEQKVLYIKQKLDSAKWYIEAIKTRQNTLYSTMNEIMKLQYNYFISGDERDMKPMIQKDIADELLLDISTISRVVNSKYVSTPLGTFLLKDFFSESVKNSEGDDISTNEVKSVLAELIDNENKQTPLTDSKLVEELASKGYKIARRTVAKYREQLGYAVARLRKEII